MEEIADYYPYYEKLLRMRLEERIAEAPEFKVLAKRYPHLAESIRLKREIEILKENLKSLKDMSKRFRIKREIISIKAKLKRENILKRLYAENKQEAYLYVRFKISISKERISSLVVKGRIAFRKVYIDLQKGFKSLRKALRELVHSKLPPTVFDLKSLDTAEKGLVVKEWVQKHHKKLR